MFSADLNMLSQSVRALGVLNFVLAIGYQLAFVRITEEQSAEYPHLGFTAFGGPFKYLTFWNLLLQLLFFIIALRNDLKHGARKGKKYSKTF